MISVIVPVYRVEPYLRQCVDSLLMQTYTNLEVLLIDDGSPDCCGSICDEYSKNDSRVRAIHTDNQGVSTARNLGIEEANGDLISFIDPDDWIEPTFYELLLARMKDTDADICACNYWMETETSKQKSCLPETIYERKASIKALCESGISNYIWNKLYRKELFNTIRFPVGKTYEDFAIMHLILHQSQRVAVIANLLYHYRTRSDSITKTYKAKNLIDYAGAYFSRYCFLKNEYADMFFEKQEDLLRLPANGISRIWRWWYGCSIDERKEYVERLKEYSNFAKENFPLFGFRSWPMYIKTSVVFMRSTSQISFAVLYLFNQLYRRMKNGQ